MIANDGGGISVLDMNFDAYASTYLRFSKRYEVLKVPFQCEVIDGYDGTRSLAKGRKVIGAYRELLKRYNDPSTTRPEHMMISQTAKSIVSRIIGSNKESGHKNYLSYASLSRNKERNIDRGLDFTKGAFSAYYCGDTTASIWPDIQSYQNSHYQDALSKISTDVASMSFRQLMLFTMQDIGADLTF